MTDRATVAIDFVLNGPPPGGHRGAAPLKPLSDRELAVDRTKASGGHRDPVKRDPVKRDPVKMLRNPPHGGPLLYASEIST